MTDLADVFWHKADSLSRLATCPLLGGKSGPWPTARCPTVIGGEADMARPRQDVR